MHISDSELETKRGNVIGIGRVKIPKVRDFNYEIPLLSFVVIKKTNAKFVATCIHLQIDGYGKTSKEAQVDMVSNILYFLYENFNNEKCKDNAWRNILDLFKSNKMSSELWDKYHAFQIILAERGTTTDSSESHNNITKLQEKIIEVFGKETSGVDKEKIPSAAVVLNIIRSNHMEADMIVKYSGAA